MWYTYIQNQVHQYQPILKTEFSLAPFVFSIPRTLDLRIPGDHWYWAPCLPEIVNFWITPTMWLLSSVWLYCAHNNTFKMHSSVSRSVATRNNGRPWELCLDTMASIKVSLIFKYSYVFILAVSWYRIASSAECKKFNSALPIISCVISVCWEYEENLNFAVFLGNNIPSSSTLLDRPY